MQTTSRKGTEWTQDIQDNKRLALATLAVNKQEDCRQTRRRFAFDLQYYTVQMTPIPSHQQFTE